MFEKVCRFYLMFGSFFNKCFAFLLCLNSFAMMKRPSIFLLVILLVFAFPFIYAFLELLSFIPYMICSAYIEFVETRGYRKAQYRYNKNRRKSNKNDQYNRSDDWEGYSYNQYQSYNNYKQNERYNYSDHREYRQTQTGIPKSEFEQAMMYYGMKMPFTEEQLRDKRRKMMKTAHPDVGGSADEAEKINMYFNILKKYAD